MKLSEDATARARLRMLRVWLTPGQFRDIHAGLKEVQAAPRGDLRRRLAAGVKQAGKLVAVRIRLLMGISGRSGA